MKNQNTENKEIRKYNIYKTEDSGKFYILITFAPLILSMVLSMILSSAVQGNEGKFSQVTSTLWFACVESILTAVVFIATFLIYNKVCRKDYKQLNINFKLKWHTYFLLIAIGLVSLFGIQYFISVIDNALGAIGFPVQTDLSQFNPTSVGKYFLAILFYAILPAIYEELMFRGIILTGLRSRFNDVIAVLLSALMFAMWHKSLQQFIYPLLLGCVMGWIVLRTGSLISSMIVHFVNNFTVITLSFIKNTTGASMDIKSPALFYVLAFLLLIITFGIYYLIDRYVFKHKNKQEKDNNVSSKTSIFLYASLAIAFFVLLFFTILDFLS